ncbi:MAG TPA: sugar phosphate isomerase/epimerase [Terriglobia bacterium]|nr:sugar phosphate isomerase/epimerase [Terriglobia bacterium]
MHSNVEKDSGFTPSEEVGGSSRRDFLKSVGTSVATLAASAAGDRLAAAPAVPDLRIRSKSADPPRLRVAHSWWSLGKLPRDGPEWTMEEKFHRVKEAGFEGIEFWVEEKDEDRVRALLDQTGLFLGTGFHPNSPADFRKALTQARRLHAEYIFVHPGNAFMSDEDAAALVREGYKIAQDLGVPMTLETHRGTVTENPYRAMRLAERVPELRLTGDLSHYGVGGEIGGAPASEMIRLLSPLLDRIETLQTRITNGEQVQLDVGQGEGELAQKWVALWAEVLRRWRKRAQPGDWFPFSTELGPPAYSIVDAQGREVSDRWAQSLVMKRLMAQAWEKSSSA